MPSPNNVRFILTLTNICHLATFSLYPLYFEGQTKTFLVSKIASWKRTCILISNFLNAVFISVQIFIDLHYKSISRQTNCLFLLNAFELIITIMHASYLCGYIFCAHQFCCVLNCMIRNPGGILFKSFYKYRRSDNFIFIVTLLAVLATVVLFIVIFPLIDIFKFWIQNHSIYHSMLFILRIMFRITYLVPACLIVSITSTICFVTIKELCDYLSDLLALLTQKLNHGCTRRESNWCIGMYYRQTQVFAILVNDCFAHYFWPVIQFLGALICIGLLYIFDCLQ